MKGHRARSVASVAREPMALWEHFALTVLVAGGWVFPYLMAAL